MRNYISYSLCFKAKRFSIISFNILLLIHFLFSLPGRLGFEGWRSSGVEQMRYFCSLTYIEGLVVGVFPGYGFHVAFGSNYG